jgi:energy-coupling factor transport system ATP-binding protein
MGRDVHRISRREAVKLVGYAWQNPYAGFVEATVADELEFTSKVVGVELKREIVDLLVPRHLLDRNPFTLSGGEAKRVSIASVLAVDQPVWLLDEPFDYMDCEGVRSLAKVINYGVEKGQSHSRSLREHLLHPHA